MMTEWMDTQGSCYMAVTGEGRNWQARVIKLRDGYRGEIWDCQAAESLHEIPKTQNREEMKIELLRALRRFRQKGRFYG